MIEEYRSDIHQLKEEIMCKDQVIETLSESIAKKGEETAKLTEKLSVLKNQIIDSTIFN
jgi:uncharacterized coiled-coil protein SlyX